MNNPDTELNQIGVLRRREIEARVVAPLLQALGERFGHPEVRAVAREVIEGLAREQGAALAGVYGPTLEDFDRSLENWTKDGALEIEVLERSETALSFNVHRCRYAEMYRRLGVPELGGLLSCNRDGALMAGFRPDVEFTRTQTIMQGAAFCDFRYRAKNESTED